MIKQWIALSWILSLVGLWSACGTDRNAPGAKTTTATGGVAGGGTGGSAGASDPLATVGGAIEDGTIVAVPCEAASDLAAETRVTLDGNDIAQSNVHGLTFKGFGVLSANGTSELLMDYKSEHPEQYRQMLEILFGGTRPVMNHVKIELGNDRNNSTGPDPATMRLADEPVNVRRAPGFQLAADAKKLNPNLKVSVLRWNSPGWANDNDKIYSWYKNTILAAYRTYGYMVDYVNPGVNESAANIAWTKQYADRIKADSDGFASTEEQALYSAIQLVISDEAAIGTFGPSMTSDAALLSAVAAAGYHYNTDDDAAGSFKTLADTLDKEIWNSEAQATFSNSAFRPNNNMADPSVPGTGIGGLGGPLEMGNTIIKGFVNSRRSHFIYQPAIGSFYEGGQYAFKEVLSARDPWSGWIHYDVALDVLRHFSWFSKTGWEDSTNSRGIWRAVPKASATGAVGTNPVIGRNGSPSYLTLAAPNKKDFSIVLMNDSEQPRSYALSTTNMAFMAPPNLEIWETRAADPGAAFKANYLKYRCTLTADSAGIFTVTVKPYSVSTVTTLKNTKYAEYDRPLPVEGTRTVLDTDATGATHDITDDFLYADDFDYSTKSVPVLDGGGTSSKTESFIESRGGSLSVIPRYVCDRNGAFEAHLPSGSTNYVLRQQLDQALMGLGGTWNNGDPITAVGDNRWLNYKASVDVTFEHDNLEGGKNYAALGARQQGGSSSHSIAGTPYVLKFTFDGSWQFLVDGTAAIAGNVVTGTGGVTIAGFDARFDAWHNLALEVSEGTVTAWLDDTQLTSYADPKPRLSGRVDLGSGYYNTRFDNLKVRTLAGQSPYYSELLDNLEMNDLSSPPLPKLTYSGTWVHQNGKGMYNYQRSLSTSGTAGATLSYSFLGTGLDILGPNGGTAVLEVTVDGQVVQAAASTFSSKEFYQTFSLRGLSPSAHSVQLKLVSGLFVVDAVAVIP